jgi:hypothetical protein
MENAGMVTYDQTIILAKPETDTITRQRLYASIAAHELAHQWFGDLVTTSWWNDIWLNEAFATWLEQKILAEWKPDWKTRMHYVDDKLYAEDQDSLVSARGIRQAIETKGDIGNAFDGITYQKGAAVIGMFEAWMGTENFRRGVQLTCGNTPFALPQPVTSSTPSVQAARERSRHLFRRFSISLVSRRYRWFSNARGMARSCTWHSRAFCRWVRRDPPRIRSGRFPSASAMEPAGRVKRNAR